MIQVKYQTKYEDRFNIAYREWISRLRLNNETVLLKDLESVNHDIDFNEGGAKDHYIHLVADIHAYTMKHFIYFLHDLESIMGIPIEVRFISCMQEAYDAGNLYCIPWFKFSR
jgi:hypothetical protein